MIERVALNRDFWRDRPVFVTGATGLLGSWLVQGLLELDADVTCLVRDHVPRSRLLQDHMLERVNVVRGDVADFDLVERALGEYETKTVFHLAAQTIVSIANRNPRSTFDTNIRGSYNLLEACRRSPMIEQVVVASSDKAYGIQEELPYDEDAPLQGCHPYDVSKSCTDLIAKTYHKTYGLSVCVTRCGNIFGPGDLNWDRLIPGTIRSVVRDKRPIIRSDGTLVRDYFFVKDCAMAYLVTAEKMGAVPEVIGEPFNFSLEKHFTVLEMTELILQRMGSSLEPDVLGKDLAEIPHQYLSARKAAKLLGWKPAYSVEEALDHTVAWYRDLLQ